MIVGGIWTPSQEDSIICYLLDVFLLERVLKTTRIKHERKNIRSNMMAADIIFSKQTDELPKLLLVGNVAQFNPRFCAEKSEKTHGDGNKSSER